MKIIAGLVGGLVFAYLGSIVATMAFLFVFESGTATTVTILILWVVGLAMAVTAETAGRAWRRLLLSSAILSFLLPLAGILMAGSMVAANPGAGGAEAAGTLIGGGLAAGALGFVGLFLGLAFLVAGLLVGRDRPVAVVLAQPE